MKLMMILGTMMAMYMLTMVCIFTCYAQAAGDSGGRTAFSIIRCGSQPASPGGKNVFISNKEG